jgi:hypothetical protein
VLGRFFAVLTITSSFLVRFQPVKYRIEAIIMFFGMVKGAVSSIQLLVWSMVWSNLGQTWSTLVKLGQSSPNSGKCIPDHVLRVSQAWWTLFGSETVRSNLGQTWSTLVKHGQTSGNVSRTFFLGLFDVASPRWIRPTWFGLSRLRADTRENPVGKNGVMTEITPLK